MCGRYAFYDHQELSERLTNVTIDADFLQQFRPTWNAAPSQRLPVIVEDKDAGAPVPRSMSWGLIPRWTRPGEKPKVTPINARSETLTEKPMFRSLITSRRCVVPANGFYEWQRHETGKQPFFITRDDGQLMLFAGLYDEVKGADGDPLESYAIITTAANERMSALHDRMPVILDPDDVADWLDPEQTATGPLEHLLRPAEDGSIALRPVSKEVNSVRHNGPGLIEPLDDEDEDEASET